LVSATFGEKCHISRISLRILHIRPLARLRLVTQKSWKYATFSTRADANLGACGPGGRRFESGRPPIEPANRHLYSVELLALIEGGNIADCKSPANCKIEIWRII
jgi:hypothetical protein